MVFDTEFVKNMTYFGIADSGMWEAVCNLTYNHGTPDKFWPGPLDCDQPTAPGIVGLGVGRFPTFSRRYTSTAARPHHKLLYFESMSFPHPLDLTS